MTKANFTKWEIKAYKEWKFSWTSYNEKKAFWAMEVANALIINQFITIKKNIYENISKWVSPEVVLKQYDSETRNKVLNLIFKKSL